MNLAIAFNTNGIITANVILVLREKSDLSTIVFQQTFTANSQHNVTVMDLNPVMHQVEIWDTNDGTTLNALKGQCDMDASQGTGNGGFSYIQFVVGSGVVVGSTATCPVDGATQYVDTSLDAVDYLVSKGGFGILTWGTEIQQIAGGGFEYIDGQKFGDLSEYTIIKPGTGVIPVAASSSTELSDVIIHTADSTLTSTDRGKLHVFNYAGEVAVLTMETLVGVPNKTLWAFNTHQGNQINGEIKFQSGQGCWFKGQLRNRIFLGKNEFIKMLVKSGVCYCIEYNGEYNRIGERVMSDVLSGDNLLPLNGSDCDGTVYKRTYEWLTTVVSSSQKVTYTDYDAAIVENGVTIYTNRGKWAIDTTAKTFKTPVMLDSYPKAVAGGREAGTYQKWQVGAHFHAVGTETDPTGSVFKRVVAHLKRFWSSGNGGSSDGSSTDYNADPNTLATVVVSYANEVKNIGYYPVVII